MNLKILFLTILTGVSAAAFAQDKIYKTDGKILNVKVQSVGGMTVIYKRSDNPDGPEYTILKSDIAQIKYENGTTDNFAASRSSRGARNAGMKGRAAKYKKKYGDNIISLIPGAYTAGFDGTINDAGLGICYERLLDEHGHISFNLPVMISFSSTRDFNNSTFFYNNYNNYNYNGKGYNSYYFMPGIKFYPANGNQTVRYSLGASFFAIFGTEPMGVYDNGYNGTTIGNPYDNYSYAMYGFMISNSVNITATRHLFLSVDLGTGIPISDNRHSNNGGSLDVILEPWMQFGLKIGYRY